MKFLGRMATGRNSPPSKSYPWFSRGGHLIALDEREAEDFHEIVALLLKQTAPKDEASRDAVTSVLSDAMFAVRAAEAANVNNCIDDAVANIVGQLRRKIRSWSVYFPVAGLYDDCLPLKFGDVTFFPSTESLSELVVSNRSGGDDNLRALIRRQARKDIVEHFDGAPWVQVVVHARDRDSTAARDLAVEKLGLTLDVVNFFADIFRPQEYRARVQHGYEKPWATRVNCVVMEGEEATGVGWTNVGALDDVWLPPLGTDESRAMGLDRAHEILAKESRSEVDRRLLAALRWSGRAASVKGHPNQLLAYMMAFEAAVAGPRQIRKIAKTLGSRATQLFRDDNSRAYYSPDVARLYRLRSQLVHTGWAEVTPEAVMSARYHAKECTVRLLTMKQFTRVATNRELDAWFAPQV